MPGYTPPPVGPRPPTEYVQIYSVESADYPYPLGFVRPQSPRQVTLAGPSCQGTAGAWNPFAGSYSCQSELTSESPSHSPYNPGGIRVDRQQNPQPIAAAPPSQDAWVPISEVCLNFTLLHQPLPEYNWTRKRKALVIGINYSQHADRKFKLRHSAMDAYDIHSFLCTNLDFAPCDIRVLTDEMENPWDLPTKENILLAMKELVRDAQPGDSFFLYFSGHGMQIKDTNGDESDGLDECICAMDYCGDDPYPTSKTPGLIVDDDMHDILVRPLPQQCRLTAIFDCCHSGTILDLPVIYNSRGAAKPFIHQDGPWIGSQKISHADVVSLSASKDNQEATESRDGGALRLAFIDSVGRSGNTLTYKELIRNMRDYMGRRGFEQKPQLSTSYKINTDLRFVV